VPCLHRGGQRRRCRWMRIQQFGRQLPQDPGQAFQEFIHRRALAPDHGDAPAWRVALEFDQVQAVHRGHRRLHRHHRQQGDADIRRHHLAQRLQTGGAEAAVLAGAGQVANLQGLVTQAMAVLQQKKVLVGQVAQLEQSLLARERMFVGNRKQKRFLEQELAVHAVFVQGQARMPASSRPSRSRRRSASVFSSTSSSSSFGNAARTSGSACGSRYGPSVGKMPSRTVPDSGSSVRRATARICSTPPSTSRARSAMSRPTSVSSTLRGVRSTSGTPSSSSSFLIWVDRVGWLTKQASAARPKCRCSARATRYWRSRRFIGESVQAIVKNYGTDANNQLEQYAGAPYRAPRIPVIPRASESLPLPRRRAGCTPPARACPRRRFFLRAAPRAGRADRAFWHCVGSHADPYGGALWIAWGFPDESSCPSTRVHRTGQLLGRRVRRHGRPGAAGPVAWLGGAAVVSDRVQGGSRTAGFFRYHHDQG